MGARFKHKPLCNSAIFHCFLCLIMEILRLGDEVFVFLYVIILLILFLAKTWIFREWDFLQFYVLIYVIIFLGVHSQAFVKNCIANKIGYHHYAKKCISG